jgi:archaemetzincin
MEVHHARVFMAATRDLPANAYTTVRTPRYRADTVIAWLRGVKPDSVDLILGITAQDISITKYDAFGAVKEPMGKYRDFGIFGLGYIGGPSSVVSTFRLGDGHSPEFYDRLMKITVHEVGHNRRLPHCPDPRCVMRDAVERMSSIDAAGRTLCPRCVALLYGGSGPL